MGAEARKQYTAEFKREAVALVAEQGYTLVGAARNLGMGAIHLTQVPTTFRVSSHGGDEGTGQRNRFYRLVQQAVAAKLVSYRQLVSNHDHNM